MVLYTLLAIWFVCWFLAYGLTFAYWADEFPSNYQQDNMKFSLLWLLGGPISLTVACIHLYNEGYRGFKIQ